MHPANYNNVMVRTRQYSSEMMKDTDPTILGNAAFSRRDFCAILMVSKAWNNALVQKIVDLVKESKIGIIDAPWLNSPSKIRDYIAQNAGIESLVFAIPERSRDYNSLEYSCRQRLMDGHLDGIQNLTNLTRLDLFNCEGISGNSDIFFNLSKLTKLKDLNLGMTRYRSDNFNSLGALNSLERLELKTLRGRTFSCGISRGDPEIQIDSLRGISKLTNLSHLNVSGLDLFNTENLSEMISLPLTHLDLPGGYHLSKESINQICQMTLLTHLNLGAVKNAKKISALTNLTHLNISGCDNLGNLKGLNRLATLDLSSSSIDDHDLFEYEDLSFCDKKVKPIHLFAIFNHLVNLNLRNCRNITDEGVKWLASLSKIQTLNLSSLNITGSGLKNLGLVESLTDLNLSKCKKLSDKNLAQITFKKLQFLNLSECSLTGVGLLSLQKVKNCVGLNLSQCKELKNLSALKLIRQLTDLDLSHTNITGKELFAIRPIAKRKWCPLTLNLSHCEKLKDEELSSLGNLERLYSLNLENTKITFKTLRVLTHLQNLGVLNLIDNSPKDDDETEIERHYLEKMNALEFDALRKLTTLSRLDLDQLNRANYERYYKLVDRS